jgi:hypothetical protein
MYKTHLDVYLAIPRTFYGTSDEQLETAREALNACLDELVTLSGQIDFHLCWFDVHVPVLTLLKGRSRNTKHLRGLFSEGLPKGNEVLKVSITVPFSTHEIKDAPSDLSSQSEKIKQKKHTCKMILAELFVKQVSDLLVIANLCRVGSIELRDSVVVQDGSVVEYLKVPKMDAMALQRATELAQQIGWPKLLTLEFDQVWKWVAKHEDFHLYGVSDNPMGRALCAFSHIFEYSNRDEPMQLLWALIGIEALYVKGNTALIEQVREKAQKLLGEQEAYKKKIGSMYDFRSRFVHGDLDFSGIDTPFSDYEVFGEGLLESISLAVAVLTATLQEIIRRDWSGLTFSYEVRDSKK